MSPIEATGRAVSLQHLWAGWRGEYIETVASQDGVPSQSGSRCVFCRIFSGDASREQPDGPLKQPDGKLEQPNCPVEHLEGEAKVQPDRQPAGHVAGDDHIVKRGTHINAILNAYPYTSGHLMVVPVRHVGDLEELTPAEAAELWATTTQAVRALKAAYQPEGVNIGINLGRAAGAGVPGHLHVHVVPRWNGDTNFMTVTADTRVLPEALSRTRDKLVRAWLV